MLKKRIFTGIVIAIFLIGILFFTPIIYAEILCGLIVGLALLEWMNLMGLSKDIFKVIYSFFFLCVFFILIAIPFHYLMGSIVILWLAAVLFLYCYFPKNPLSLTLPVKIFLGYFILIPFWISISYLLQLDQHTVLLLFLLFSIAGFDSGAFFAGKAWGRHKLAPQVSPNKSIEGVLGGVLCAGCLSAVLSFSLHYTLSQGLFMLMLCMLTGLFSCVGDLLESAVKRSAGVKDSGTLLPGHGGILDRIDAYTAGAPFFSLMVYLFY